MKKIIGIICMVLGIGLLMGSFGLAMHNRQENLMAGDAAEEYLPQILDRIPQKDEEDTLQSNPNITIPTRDEPVTPPENAHDKYNSYVEHMLVTEIDGYQFVGSIYIPRLGIELPVLSETSKTLLKKFPCRFSGSPKTNNLVVGAHNYEAHFGNIDKLVKGDSVVFTDMEGNVWNYTVAYDEILSPEDVDALMVGEFPLTIYTCNYDGSKRITLRCETAK